MFRYDLGGQAWVECAPAPERVQSPVMRCVNGRLYFIGGHDSTKGVGGKTNVCAQYDPDTGVWTRRSPMPTAREDMGSAVIGREIWVLGGLDNRGHLLTAGVEVYDTVADTWTTRDEWPTPRCLGDFACTDGRAIYLISGTSTMRDYPSLWPSVTGQVYEDGFFYDLPPMPQGHCYTEVEMLNGCIYVFGGASTSTGSSTLRIERFDTRRRIWLDPLEMPYEGNGIGVTQHRGKLYISGGWRGEQFLPYFYLMDTPPSLPAVESRYAGGSGTAGDPYRIATAEQMAVLAAHPQDWSRHFRLTADIDLAGFDGRDGRLAFNGIAPDTNSGMGDFQGTPFTGVFDGDGHTISHLTVSGIEYVGLFGLITRNAQVRDLGLVDASVTGLGDCVGGLVGFCEGTISHCHSSGAVTGFGSFVGGLVGYGTWLVDRCWSTCRIEGAGYAVGGLAGANSGQIVQCWTNGAVSGTWSLGGLVGQNWGKVKPPATPRWVAQAGVVTDCYSLSMVTGYAAIGGLVGDNGHDGIVYRSYSAGPVAGDVVVGGLVANGAAHVACSFWDTRASGQLASDGGMGLATEEMCNTRTFAEAGWDFDREAENGTDDIWWIPGGWGYPRLAYRASSPMPDDGAADILDLSMLHWMPGQTDVQHDVYFGEDESAVVSATSLDPTIYRGRQSVGAAIYDPGALEPGRTYYWRVDGVNVADVNSPWRGRVWKFSTADFIFVSAVDDFEAYDDDVDTGRTVFQTWSDGISVRSDVPGNHSGAFVGNSSQPFAEQTILHGGRQSMPMSYDNVKSPWYSQADRTWTTPRDWTADGADTLTLYFRGEPGNDPDRLYVGVGDSAGGVAWTDYPDPNATLGAEWRKWHIPLANLQAEGVDPAAIASLSIRVGDPDKAQSGGRGTIYLDDIRLTRRTR